MNFIIQQDSTGIEGLAGFPTMLTDRLDDGLPVYLSNT
jgi:hypothetical protein